MCKISIIVPVYNVEKYIKRCLDSLINQTYKNLEIICIDDGSTDQSGEICDKYALKDKRIRVFHKKNSGVSSTKNLGLDVFQGDYVGFVDSDDFVEPTMYEILLRDILLNDVDISVVNYSKESENYQNIMKNKKKIKNTIKKRDDILYYAFRRDTYMSFAAYLCNKLFSSSFFKRKSEGGLEIRFDENMSIGEDVYFFSQCSLNAFNGAFYNDIFLYHYWQRSDSVMHSKNHEIKYQSIKSYSKIIELVKKNHINFRTLIYLERFYVYHATLVIEIAKENNDRRYINLLKKDILKHILSYISTNIGYLGRIIRLFKILFFY